MSKIELKDNIWCNKEPVKELSEYIQVVKEISFKTNNNVWFRGHAKSSYKNLPAIYREETWNGKKYDFIKEFEAFKRFKRESKVYRDTEFEYLQTMQHFSFPTRMLDWTKSSLIALFFAIESKQDCEDPIVWALNPNEFNRQYYDDPMIFYFYGNNVNPNIAKYLYGKDLDENQLPTFKFDNFPLHPSAVLPSYIDDRVIAQQSYFIIFGQDQTPLEEYNERNKFKLSKIAIDQNCIDDIMIDLVLSGINYSTIYPDLHGTVKEIKRMYDLK
jgi:hypothetical protein